MWRGWRWWSVWILLAVEAFVFVLLALLWAAQPAGPSLQFVV